MKDSISYSQSLHIRRNCTQWLSFLKHSLHISHQFYLCGYPVDIVNKALLQVSKKTQRELLVPSIDAQDGKKFFCIMDFNPRAPNIRQLMETYLPYLDRSSSTRSLLSIPVTYVSQFDLFTLAAASDVPDILAHRTRIMGVGSSTPMGVAGYDFEPKHMCRGPPPKLPYKRDKLVISQSVSLWLLSHQHFQVSLAMTSAPGYTYVLPPPGPTIKFLCLIYVLTLLHCIIAV